MAAATDKNLSAILFAVKDLRMGERPIPQPGPNQVQLKIEAVGICGTDVHY
ncbi:Sorbitol dehydrogenase, partial [Hypsibius exemplaris]